MIYVTLSRAYVPGGVNLYDPSQAGGAVLPSFAPTYGPETVLAREIGAKWDFRAGRLVGRINADVYDYSFTDIQENFSGQVNNVGFFYIANIAAAELRGFEASATILPSPAWEIRLAYNYNHFRYTSWTGLDPLNIAQPGDPNCVPSSPAGFCFLDLTGNPSVGTPAHQGHVAIVYHLVGAPRLGRFDFSATGRTASRAYISRRRRPASSKFWGRTRCRLSPRVPMRSSTCARAGSACSAPDGMRRSSSTMRQTRSTSWGRRRRFRPWASGSAPTPLQGWSVSNFQQGSESAMERAYRATSANEQAEFRDCRRIVGKQTILVGQQIHID